ncbi:unnamed protein product [Pleuronectes platessa]|uniref:Peptidase S26 domain-containing protein n=1 Tax=Pleuronectes platessa TaxID=8262 RepID=A0A9N7YT74_PLEPL|nr:unnamed protein product [Pleuronectes platessa]
MSAGCSPAAHRLTHDEIHSPVLLVPSNQTELLWCQVTSEVSAPSFHHRVRTFTTETLSYKNRYVRVPDGHFWIEGDHHGHSLDSNSFGPVSVGLLHGRASHIIWPPQRWQEIKASLPPNRGPLDTEEEEG